MAAARFLRDPLERRVKATAVADLLNWLPRFSERDAIAGAAHGVDFGLPYHDAAMMRLGLNLPLRYLMRPRGWRAGQSVEKWTLAQIAPRHLGDAGFFHRSTVWSSPQRQFVEPLAAPLLTPDGYVAGLMRLDAAGLEREVAAARRDPSQLAKLVHLELWGRVCLRGEEPAALGEWIVAAVDRP